MPLTFTIDSPSSGDTVGITVNITGTAVVSAIEPLLAPPLVRITLSNTGNNYSAVGALAGGTWTASINAAAGTGYILRAEYYMNEDDYSDGLAPDAIATESDITVSATAVEVATISSITPPDAMTGEISVTLSVGSSIKFVIVTTGMPGENDPMPITLAADTVRVGRGKQKKSGIVGAKLIKNPAGSPTVKLNTRPGRFPVRVLAFNTGGDNLFGVHTFHQTR